MEIVEKMAYLNLAVSYTKQQQKRVKYICIATKMLLLWHTNLF